MAESVNGTGPQLVTAPDAGLILPVRLPVFNPEMKGGQDAELKKLELIFSGAWVPDVDPLLIGSNNYADLQNLRYQNQGLEGVSGYTALTTVALAKPAMRSALQFVKVQAGTPVSYVLVQGVSGSTSAVYQHTAVIPAAGEFTVAPLFTDSAGAGLGRFATGPDGSLFYCNGVDTTVWSSPAHRAAAVMNVDLNASTFRYDLTERVTNTGQASPVLVRTGLNDINLLVGSTRPLQGITFTVGTANTSASTTYVAYWNGAAWTTVSGFTDGTAVGGVTLAQSGSMTFTSTASTAKTKWEDERLLYFYLVFIGTTGTPDATITLTQLTVNPPWQKVVDIWDGVERLPMLCVVDGKDYTVDVLETSTQAAPVGADLSGLTAGKIVYVGSEDRLTGLQIRMVGTLVNTTIAALTLSYWTGTAWSAVTVTDGTFLGAVSLGQSGAIIWDAVSALSEATQTLYGRTGYFYKLVWSADLTAGSAGPPLVAVVIDSVTGIPAGRWNAADPVPGYTFPFAFAGRMMLAGKTGGQELNRIDYSAAARPDVFNGEQSSDRGKQIYVGDAQPLTAALEMSNRYLNTLKQLAAVTKASQTHILEGSSSETFTLFLVSDSVGCPAPLSMCRAEIPSSAEGQTLRNVLLWCSHKGPIIFDGSVLLPMRFPVPGQDQAISSVDCYFTPTDSRYVNTSLWNRVFGYYDSQYSEYNLLLPSGAASTACNTWLVCDLKRRKWYRKVPTVYPQIGLAVYDNSGTAYTYGGIETGHLLRMEYGNSWNGSAIAHVLDTADIPPSGSVFDETLSRYARLAAVCDAGTGVVTLAHAPNGSGTFTTQTTLTLNGTGRYAVVTQPLNLRAFTHQYRLTCSTTDAARAPRLLGMGIAWSLERMIEQ